MAISIDATSSVAEYVSTDSVSWSHTVGAGATALFVGIAGVSDPEPNSVDWDGTNLTLVANADGAGEDARLYMLTNPEAKTANITISYGTSGRNKAGAVSVFGSGIKNTGTDTSFSETNATSSTVTLNAPFGGISVECAVAIGNTGNFTLDDSQTGIFNTEIAGTRIVYMGYKLGTQTSLTVSWATSQDYAHAGASLGRAGGGNQVIWML